MKPVGLLFHAPLLTVSVPAVLEIAGSWVFAGAGGAAHLPGMTASLTSLPVFGVPMNTHALEGKDSLLSILQMPAGIPVGTLAIGKPGAINAALLAAAVLAGAGHGIAFLAAQSELNVAAPPSSRGEVNAAFYTLTYLGVAAAVIGTGLDAASLKKAAAAAEAIMSPAADARGPVEYRKHVGGIMVMRALSRALARLG